MESLLLIEYLRRRLPGRPALLTTPINLGVARNGAARFPSVVERAPQLPAQKGDTARLLFDKPSKTLRALSFALHSLTPGR